jgi:hypothetical protein
MDVNSTVTEPNVKRGFHPEARYEFEVHFELPRVPPRPSHKDWDLCAQYKVDGVADGGLAHQGGAAATVGKACDQKNFETVAYPPECDSEPCDAFERNCSILTAKPTANRINSGTFQYMMANW